MGTKTGNRGRYICKVGYLDIYAKDDLKPKKETKRKFVKADVKSTVYNVIHAKKTLKGNFKTTDAAIASAIELMCKKVEIYGLI